MRNILSLFLILFLGGISNKLDWNYIHGFDGYGCGRKIPEWIYEEKIQEQRKDINEKTNIIFNFDTVL